MPTPESLPAVLMLALATALMLALATALMLALATALMLALATALLVEQMHGVVAKLVLIQMLRTLLYSHLVDTAAAPDCFHQLILTVTPANTHCTTSRTARNSQSDQWQPTGRQNTHNFTTEIRGDRTLITSPLRLVSLASVQDRATLQELHHGQYRVHSW